MDNITEFYDTRIEIIDGASGDTPRKTNMSPENQWLEDVFPIEIVPF